MSIHKEIFINVSQHEKRVAVLENKRIEEFYVERPDSINLLGNVYKGKVDSVLPGMGAAFVNIGLEKNGFLYVTDVTGDSSGYDMLGETSAVDGDDKNVAGNSNSHHNDKSKGKLPSISELLKKGDEVLVQIVKEPISTKGARLTTHISIPGRFLVMMPFDSHIGLSKRIESREERDRIRKIIAELKLPKELGFIVRTAAQGVGLKDFQRESRYLINLWNNIKAKARRMKPPSLIHQEYDLILRVARDMFTDDVTKLEVDSRGDFKRMSRFLRILAPQLRDRLKFYGDRIPVFEKFDIEPQIEKIYNRTVQLKSGGYLIFDQTESLLAIDVNSGKFVGKRNLEDTAFRTNMEAAEEVARQLKLRNLGGIIIIDFIDMEYGEHKKSVFRTLEKHLEGDKAKSKILSISPIGLVEMTRQRVRKSIESKSYQSCPYCNGRGMVKSIPTVAIELMRKLERGLQDIRGREALITLNPEVAYHVAAPDRNMVKPIERRFRKTIRIIEDPNMKIEDIKIEERRG